jgi:hypothetical protein
MESQSLMRGAVLRKWGFDTGRMGRMARNGCGEGHGGGGRQVPSPWTAEHGLWGLTLACGRAAVGTGAVEVDEDVAGFGAIAGADNAAVLQLIHDAGGAAVTESQSALE